ncbi:MAG: hypothetical protein P8P30_10880 [Rickettsiales bacterium]|nr:hypothetical protein [Rickettsiales bacterium]
MTRIALLCLVLFSLSACSGSWSTASVSNESGTATAPAKKKSAAFVRIMTEDITDRQYESLGDIEVNVNKTTIFHADPTKAMVNIELKEKAAELGADAVVLVRYGTVGIGLMSWGSLDGKGRAVRYLDE